MLREIKRIDPFSLGKIYGLTGAVVGLVIGILLSIVHMIVGAAAGEIAALSSLFGGMAFLLVPIFYGIVGFLGGIIAGIIYNICASWVGGIKIELMEAGDDIGIEDL